MSDRKAVIEYFKKFQFLILRRLSLGRYLNNRGHYRESEVRVDRVDIFNVLIFCPRVTFAIADTFYNDNVYTHYRMT